MLSLQKFSNNVFVDKARTPVRYAIGLATGLAGIADMLSAIVPKLHWDILLGAWPINHQPDAQKLIVVVGFFLIMLSYGLMRGKKQAWAITNMLLFLSFFLHIRRGGSVLASIVALGLLLLLVLLARFFRARSDPPSVRRGYIALILGLGVVLFYTVFGFIALYNQFESVVDRFGTDGVLLRIVTNAHLHLPKDTPAFFLDRAFPLLCVSAVLFGMVLILRPVATTLLHDEQARQKVRQHTRIYGKNSISYFAFSEEKAYFFSSSGKSVISYVLEGQVAVVAGDPIGPDSEVITAIEEFIAFCREQDWTIVLWQVRDDLAPVYRSLGLHLLKIGEDAVIDTQKFTLKGGAMANVRSSAKRAEKDGVSVTFYRGTVQDHEQRLQMELISQQWLVQKGGSEMGFSMGLFDPEGDPEQITALAVDTTNRVHAFVTFVPIYGRQGWGLDLLRRADRCAPGTIELLLARSIEYLKSGGAAMVSLGLAPLSNANNDDTTLLDTGIDFLTQRFGNLSKSQSLFNFKRKFQPTWESRYLVFSNTLTLPKIGWALYKAHQEDATLFKTLRNSILGWQKSYKAVKEKIVTGALEALKV
jgi:phosphatidylglycerol lysyltransferase